MSILDKILVKSKTSKSKKHAVPKGRRLGFEGLEERELLAVYTVDSLEDYNVYHTNAKGYYYKDSAGEELADTFTTLRMAIRKAQDSAEADTVRFGVDGTIRLNGSISYDLNLVRDQVSTNTITIIGNGTNKTVISGQNKSGGLSFIAAHLSISNLTLANINGSISFAAPIYLNNYSDTTVDVKIKNVHFTNNTGGYVGVNTYHGNNNLTIEDSLFQNNAGTNHTIILHGSTTTITNTIIDSNGNKNGSSNSGGIEVHGSELTLVDSKITNNFSGRDGAGIYQLMTGGKTIAIKNSIISGNEAARYGGGIYAEGTIVVTNSLISGNKANYGGGVYISHGDWTFTNVTIAGNRAEIRGGGLYIHAPNSVKMNNTIVARNSAPEHPDIYYFQPSTLTIGGGNNLIGTQPADNIKLNGSNLIGADPQFVKYTTYTTWTRTLWTTWDLHSRRTGIGYLGDVVVPATPATASAVSASGNVTKISWSKVDGATSYDIMGYNAKDKYWWKIGTTGNTSYTAPAYTANVTMIAVHAVNSAGRSTGKTASIFRAPTTVSAVAASGQTKISWNAVAGATSYEIMGYNKAGNYWWKIGTTNKTSYNAPGYTANVTTIAVHAIRASDRTGGAATSIFRAPAGVFVVAASATQTKITWNAVSGATSYDIMGYNKAGNYWWKIGNVKGTSYNAPGYSANVTTIAIHAIRASDRTAGTTAPVVRAPSNVVASSLSSTSIRFSWNAVTGATRYELVIYNSVTKKWSTLTSVTQNTYTATGLPVGVTQVSVHAVNAAGRTAGATATVR